MSIALYGGRKLDNEKLLERYRLKLINLHLSTITVVSVFEIIAYIILHFGEENVSYYYLPMYVIIPILINFTAHFIVRWVACNKQFEQDVKNASVIYGALATSCVLTLFHMDYITTACTFCFPIVLSGMFCNKKLLNRALIVTISCLVLTTVISCTYKTTDITFLQNQLVVYGINIISYLAALLTIDFTQNNFNIINGQFIANRKLRHGIRRDQMTGLYNHVTFFSEFEKVIEDAENRRISLCVAVIDIDDFKTINDKYGHENGDKVLLKLSNVMKECSTPEDKVFRYGGEEFVILFINKSFASAKTMVTNMLTAFSNSQYDFAKVKTTFSCGIVQYNPSYSKDALFSEADGLMYKAKKNGKNQIKTLEEKYNTV